VTTLARASEGDQNLTDLEIGNLTRIGWKVAVVEANDKDVLGREPLGSFEGCQSNRRTARLLSRGRLLFLVLRKPRRFFEDPITKRRRQPAMEQATMLDR
jgi:hypothetical protein